MIRMFTLAAIGLAFSASPTFAGLLAYEPFNQPNTAANPSFPNDGSSIDGTPVGSFGFSGDYFNSSNPTNGPGIETGSLSSTLVSSQGNKLGRESGNTNLYYTEALVDTTSGGNFSSYLEPSGTMSNSTGNNIGAAGTTLYFSFLYSGATADSPSGKLTFLRNSDNGNQSGVLQVQVTASSVSPAADLYVGEIQFGAGDADTLYSAVDPTDSSDLASAATGNFSFDRLQYLGIGDFQYDEVRFGSTFASVDSVPEPASLSLLAIGGVALLGRRGRRIA